MSGLSPARVVIEAILEGTRDLGIPLSDSHYASLRFIVVGVIIVLIVVVRPQGIFGSGKEMSFRR